MRIAMINKSPTGIAIHFQIRDDAPGMAGPFICPPL